MRQSLHELAAMYQDNLFAVAFNICQNTQDAEDVIQDTFVQYYTTKKEFDNEEHIRAWLIWVGEECHADFLATKQSLHRGFYGNAGIRDTGIRNFV